VWHSKLVTGETPYNWKWEVKKTPAQWWKDFKWKHPSYNPRQLDESAALRIYGSPPSLWDSAPDEEDYDRDEGYAGDDFMYSHFGDDFKYVLSLTGFKYQDDKEYKGIHAAAWKAYEEAVSSGKNLREANQIYLYMLHGPGGFDSFLEESKKQWRDTHYDPFGEAPKAYLYFCRLSRLLELGWSSQKIINEVLKFVNKFGPPWYAEYAKLYSPPFDEPLNGPLTIDGILFQSLNMASTLKAYRLLSDISEDIRAIGRLKAHMQKLQKEDRLWQLGLCLKVDNSGYATVEDLGFDKLPSLNTENDVVSAATAFVISSINNGLVGVKPGLSSKVSKDSSSNTWTPRYEYVNLLDAMWLQFYFEILGNVRFRECANENCRAPFSVTRSNKEYCSKECGIKQYMRDHAKKKEAKK
jgi:hypothetical protein